ncbi:MAG: single-stranded-DNA-specific exonuclease RecJ [Methylotenera sp.]|nr:single-stranded-DNA-specific exonuclease RecJ [Methylotenera sp.]MDP1754623.1 single-stranded-DNA-specific exonuclease RecJ [Methylotenera sp.]MDP1959879.1 single-stranded-DNA-specific exonuclease RecJ [Methylotenera sp.]MDP3206555.1 single-stranded-DNA-specific exonuclease RecJ [Methylotenera sp.]MDP3303901.1 single-stranded-DNA-specific exonuclease RecJ [Methylotenera sp.]
MTSIVQRQVSAEVTQILQSAGLSPLMSRLFAARGVVDVSQMSANLSRLLPPQSLTHNQAMAKLLADAIATNQKLLVVGDYDADGATATAVAVKGLRAMGANVGFLVPNRFEYGYGLTPEIVALAALQKPDVIITVDNGIASVDGVSTANALGIQVLITDHHLPGQETPQAACIINPNQHGCTFASKHLAGVGVMFYCLLALRAELRERGAFVQKTEPNLTELLDLVALGTVADLVKLDENNRILVEQGLRRIRAGACSYGVTALLKIAARAPATASAQDLGFYVGPRLNAAGRLEDMTLGIQCLLAETESQAEQIAQQLHDLNVQRRSIEADMQDSANISLEEIQIAHQYSISMYQPDWHQGVIGILASRIKERHHRPVIAFADAGDGLLKGSGRSIAGLHLRDALDLLSKHQPDLIVKFGGHAMAAGLTIKLEDFDLFKLSFEIVVKSLITEADLESLLEVDGNLSVNDMTFQAAQMLENQVWGQGFAPPLFYDAFEVISQRILGEKHLKLSLKPVSSQSSPVIDAIYFNQTDLLGNRIQAAYQLQTNSYNGAQKVQLNLRYVAH